MFPVLYDIETIEGFENYKLLIDRLCQHMFFGTSHIILYPIFSIRIRTLLEMSASFNSNTNRYDIKTLNKGSKIINKHSLLYKLKFEEDIPPI